MTVFGPKGMSETLLVECMASLLWEQQRLDRPEQLQMIHAAKVGSEPPEVSRKMQRPAAVDWVCALFGLLDAPESHRQGHRH